MAWRLGATALALGLLAAGLAATVGADRTGDALRVTACATPTAPAGSSVEVVGRATRAGRGLADATVGIGVDGELVQRTTTTHQGWFSVTVDPGSSGVHEIHAELVVIEQTVHAGDSDRDVFVSSGSLVRSSNVDVTVREEPGSTDLEAHPACEWVYRPQGSSQAGVFFVVAGQVGPDVPLEDDVEGTTEAVHAQVYAEKPNPCWHSGVCTLQVDPQRAASATPVTGDDRSFALAVGPFEYADQSLLAPGQEDCNLFLEVEHAIAVEGAEGLREEAVREDLTLCG